MKQKIMKIIFSFLLIMSCPIVISAGGGDDDSVSKYQLEIPQYKSTYVTDYYDTYTCKYRLNLSPESPIYYGSFDFTINISKLGKVNSVIVAQASEISDLTDLYASKIETINSISNVSYNKGYSCPTLMAFLSEKTDSSNGHKIAVFEVKNYNSSEYSKYDGQKLTIGRYYRLNVYERIGYKCDYDQTSCNSQENCKWVVIDTGHKEYGCVEKEWGTTDTKPPETTMRTENCTGYYQDVFQQTVEYSFSIDGQLSANIGSGDFFMGWGSTKWIDKDGKLWQLWKEGKCCSNDKLGVVGDVTEETVTLSCDGSDSAWEFEDDYEEPEDPTPDIGAPVYGCDVIPDEIREWINSTLNLVKYIALVLVIVLGILDFIKAAASGEADQMKKSGSSFLKRIIAVVILFLLPVIVELVLNLIEIYGADSTCLPN